MSNPLANRNGPVRCSTWYVAPGIFFVVLAVYILSSAGRIDIVDGQARYDVAYNWLTEGRPVLRDSWIGPFMGVPGRDGLRYSYYGAPASFFSIPLLWLAKFFDTPAREVSRFLFSLTSCFFGAAIAGVLFLFYVELGVSHRRAVFWVAVSSFATLLWPLSTSTFDNAQHAFFLLAASYLGFMSAKRSSKLLAAASGSLAAVLILYQEYFLLLVPVLAVSTLRWDFANDAISANPPVGSPKSWYSELNSGFYYDLRRLFELARAAFREGGEARASCDRFLLCAGTAVTVGLALSFTYNNLRFGSFLDDGKLRPELHPFPLFGNPLAGLVTLLLSPGKSVFLYSPPLILGLLAILHFRVIQRAVAFTVVTTSIVLISFLSCILFVGGDWCWGPRYLAPLLPLWALGLPFLGGKIRREVVLSIIGAGLIIQMLALSVENQRFFFERSLPAYFWAYDPWFYFKHSALFARVSETISLSKGLPSNAQFFNSIPISDWCTYTILGPPVNLPSGRIPEWMLHFKIYYLPRPWPLWMSWIKPAMRPINLQAWVYTLLGILGIGLVSICRGLELGLKKRSAPYIEVEKEAALP